MSKKKETIETQDTEHGASKKQPLEKYYVPNSGVGAVEAASIEEAVKKVNKEVNTNG